MERKLIKKADYIIQLPKKRVAAGLLIQKYNKFLIVKPSYRDYWEIPGGIVELGESPLQASIK